MFERANKKSKPIILNNVLIQNVSRPQYAEVLLNNIVDKDLQLVLKPLNLAQNLFFCAKFSIRDNFVTSNSRCYNYFSIFCAILYTIFLSILLIISCVYLFSRTTVLIIILQMFYQAYSACFGYTVNIISNIVHCNNNVCLLLKIQHVLRSLKIDGRYLRRVLFFNWIAVVFISILYILGKINENFKIEVNTIIIQSPTILFEVNILYATCIVKLLKKALNVWTAEVKMPITQGLEDKCYWNKMFKMYLNILESYDLFQKTFRLLVRLLLLINFI